MEVLMDEATIKRMKVPDLKKECEKRGLSKSGLKAELVTRLLEVVQKASPPSVLLKSSSSNEPIKRPLEDSASDKKKKITTTMIKEDADTTNHLKESGRLIKRPKTDSSMKEEEIEDESEMEEFVKIREGPSEPAMDKLSKHDMGLVFTKQNLEVFNSSGNYANLEYAKANVAVRSGRWYFEVIIRTSGQIQVGWCTSNCDIQNNIGAYWVLDGSKGQLIDSKGQVNRARTSHDYLNNGEVIGCSLDIDRKVIAFWKNGKEMLGGPIVIPLDAPSNSNNNNPILFCPLVGISRFAKCTLNFGKTPFAFPQENGNMLYSQFTPKELRQLGKLFIHYRDISNKEVKSNTEEFKNSIHGSGLQEFQKDLGITDDEDPAIWIISWKLRAQNGWELSKDEFMNGFGIAGVSSLESIKAKAVEWKKQIKTNDQNYKQFYNFVFDYLRDGKSLLPLEVALIAWNIALKEKMWSLLDDFTEYLKASKRQVITRDVWHQLWHFMESFPHDLKDYDPTSCWPILYDEFVEWMEAKGKKPKSK